LRDKSNSLDVASALYSLLASTCTYVQRHAEAMTYCEEGLVKARLSENKYHEVALRTTSMFCKRAADKDHDMENELIELTKFCQTEGFRVRQAHLLGLLGQHYQLKGALKQAQEVLERAILVSESIQNDETKAMSMDYLGEVLIKLGKFHDAVLIFQQSTLVRRQLSDRLGVATGYRGAGRGLLALGEFDFALKMFERAIGQYKSLGNEILEGGAWLYKGLALVKLDRFDASNDAFELAKNLLQPKEGHRVLHATDPDLHPLLGVIVEETQFDCRDLALLYRIS